MRIPLGMALILSLAPALSCGALAQDRTAAASGSANPQKAQVAQSPAAKAPAAFDAHDLSGIWNMSFPPNATEPELEIYVSQFGKGEPPMTPWSKERFDKTKPAFGQRRHGRFALAELDRK